MTIDLKITSTTGDISYRMNFDSVLSAMSYGDAIGKSYEVLATYYDPQCNTDVTKVVWQSDT